MKSRLFAATLIVASLGLGACTVTPARVAVYPGYHEPPPRVIVTPPPRVIVAPRPYYTQPYVVIQPGFDNPDNYPHRPPRRRPHHHWHD